VTLAHRALGVARELFRRATGRDLRDAQSLAFQGSEKVGFVGEALVLDKDERLVILSASKRRLQILEGERGRMLALQEGDQVARRIKRLAVASLQLFPPAPLYRGLRAKLKRFRMALIQSSSTLR